MTAGVPMLLWIPLVQIGSLEQSKKESLTELYVVICSKIMEHGAGYESMKTQRLYDLLHTQPSVNVIYSVVNNSQVNTIKVILFVVDTWCSFWGLGNGIIIVVRRDLMLQWLRHTEN